MRLWRSGIAQSDVDDSALAPDRRQMSQERGANPLGPIFVDEREDNLGLAGLDDDVAAAADQGRAPVFIRDRDQRDMLNEVDVEEIVGLFLGNFPFDRKETKVERFRACPRERRAPAIEVLRTLGADRDRAPVMQRLGTR